VDRGRPLSALAVAPNQFENGKGTRQALQVRYNSRFGERFRDDQYTVWSVSCLLFFCSRYPRAQPFVKVGEGAPCPVESAPLYLSHFSTSRPFPYKTRTVRYVHLR